MKIIYISRNNISSTIQMHRIVEELRNYNHIVKVMGYNNFLDNYYIDWDISALECFSNEDSDYKDQLIKEILQKQIASFNPDIILSDVNAYYSKVCKELGYKVWQISSDFLANFITKESETNTKVLLTFKRYKHLIRNIEDNINLIDTSDRYLVYSFLPDFDSNIILNKKYEWCRPYFCVGEKNKNCKYDIVGVELTHRKLVSKLVDSFTNTNNKIIFQRFFEPINNIKINSIYSNEYACSINNSTYIINEGFTSTIADCIYNNKYNITIPNLYEPESIINSYYCNYFGIGETLFKKNKLELDLNIKEITFNSNVKFLHTLLKEV